MSFCSGLCDEEERVCVVVRARGVFLFVNTVFVCNLV